MSTAPLKPNLEAMALELLGLARSHNTGRAEHRRWKVSTSSFQMGPKGMGKGSTLCYAGYLKPEEVLNTMADSCIMRSLSRSKHISRGHLNRCTQHHPAISLGILAGNAEIELHIQSFTMHWTLDVS